MSIWTGTGTVEEPTSGTFETATSWRDGIVPGQGGYALFSSGNYAVSLSHAIKLGSLEINSGVQLDLNGGSIVATDTDGLANNGTIHLNGASITASGRIQNYSAIIGDGQMSHVNGRFINHGLIQSSLSSGGLVTFNSDEFQASGDYSFENRGDVNSTGEIRFAGYVYNAKTMSSNLGGKILFYDYRRNFSGEYEYVPATVTNLDGNGVLEGGTWQVSGSFSSIVFYSTLISELAYYTCVQLVGPNSLFGTLEIGHTSFTSIESSLTAIDAGATLQVLGDRDYTTSNTIKLGGTLQLGGGTFSGNLEAVAGSLLSGYGTVSGQVTGPNSSGSAGNVSVDINQTLTFTGFGNYFSGSLTGEGTIAFSGGFDVIKSGATLGVKGLVLSDAILDFQSNEVYQGALTMSAGDMYTNTELLIFKGPVSFSGGTVHGAGRLYLEGTTTIEGDTWTLIDSMRVYNTKSITAEGDITLGSYASFTNTSTSTYTLATDGADILTTSDAVGTFRNYGVIEKTVKSGSSTIDVKMYNYGLIKTAADLTLSGGTSGTGKISIAGSGKLEIASAVSSRQTISFADGAKGTLLIDAGRSYNGTVAGLTASDTLDFGGVTADGAKTYYTARSDGSGGTLVVKNGTQRASIHLDGQFLASAFQTASDGHGGTAVTYTPTQDNRLLLAATH